MSPNSETATTSTTTSIATSTASTSTASPTLEKAPAADQGTKSVDSVALTMTLPANLHARPAGKLAQTAARFNSAIRLDCGAKSVNPKGVLAVMSLGATAGTSVTLRAEGDDAEQAVQALADVLANAE